MMITRQMGTIAFELSGFNSTSLKPFLWVLRCYFYVLTTSVCDIDSSIDSLKTQEELGSDICESYKESNSEIRMRGHALGCWERAHTSGDNMPELNPGENPATHAHKKKCNASSLRFT